MTFRRWVTRILAGCGAVLLLLLFLTVLFIPSGELLGVVQRAMARQGLTLEVGRVGKVLPLGVTATNVVLSTEQGVLFVAERLDCRLQLLPLLLGRVSWSSTVRVGSGELALSGTLEKKPRITLSSRNLRLEKIPFLKTVLGGSVQGELGLSGTLHGAWPNAKGGLKVDITALELRDVALGGVRLPDALYRSMRGQVDVGGRMITLQSLALDGDGVYGRLKGSFPLTSPPTAAPLNLTFELMPKPEFMERQKLIFLLLTRFMVSPGSYQIPVKGTLGAPAIL